MSNPYPNLVRLPFFFLMSSVRVFSRLGHDWAVRCTISGDARPVRLRSVAPRG